MKSKLLILSFLTLCTCSAILYSSCSGSSKTDYCYGITCLNGGICTGSGDCNCPAGYGGKYCGEILRDRYIGTYYGVDSTFKRTNSTILVVADTLTILADPSNIGQVLVHSRYNQRINFGGLSSKIYYYCTVGGTLLKDATGKYQLTLEFDDTTYRRVFFWQHNLSGFACYGTRQ